MDTKRFDWVKARANCDSYHQFSTLRELVHSDCDSAKEYSAKRSELKGIVFQFTDGDPNVFTVMRNKDSRIFRLEGDLVTVTSRKGGKLYEARTMFKDDNCLLEVAGKLLTTCEFSRLALV